MPVPVLFGRTVGAAGAIRGGTAKLALFFIAHMLMLFVRAVETAGAMRSGTAMLAFTHDLPLKFPAQGEPS